MKRSTLFLFLILIIIYLFEKSLSQISIDAGDLPDNIGFTTIT